MQFYYYRAILLCPALYSLEASITSALTISVRPFWPDDNPSLVSSLTLEPSETAQVDTALRVSHADESVGYGYSPPDFAVLTPRESSIA